MGLEALLSSQVIGLNEAIDDQVAALLVAGTGITLTYNDGAGTLTIASSGGLGGSTGSTDNRVLRSDGTGGSTVQNSAVTIDDSGNISGLGTVACGPITISATGAATKVLQWSSASSNYLRNDGVVAVIDRILSFGLNSRIELSAIASADAKSAPQFYEVELARSEVTKRGLAEGQQVRIVPSQLRVFENTK